MSKTTKTVLVRCTFVIPVEVPLGVDEVFAIEDNGCPGTGVVGRALDDHIERCDAEGVCWACKLQGKNEIVTSP